MANPFNIELSKDFPAHDKAMANAELNIFSKVVSADMNLFNKAWSGWPSDDTAPKAGRDDASSQSLLDAGLKYAFEDLWKGHK